MLGPGTLRLPKVNFTTATSLAIKSLAGLLEWTTRMDYWTDLFALKLILIPITRFPYLYYSVDAKHHGASLSEQWTVTWVGNNSVCTH